MSDKYIIRNCPSTYQNFEDKFVCTSQIKEKGFPFYCQDCTNCVMKQIVELCEGIKCPCEYKGADCWECTESGARRFANKILKLLDIQEVEDE